MTAAIRNSIEISQHLVIFDEINRKVLIYKQLIYSSKCRTAKRLNIVCFGHLYIMIPILKACLIYGHVSRLLIYNVFKFYASARYLIMNSR
jgi:hypothetical protein